jgi:hypothetical protein
VERVSKGASLSKCAASAAPFDTASSPPFDKPFDKLRTWLRTQLRPTQDATGLLRERLPCRQDKMASCPLLPTCCLDLIACGHYVIAGQGHYIASDEELIVWRRCGHTHVHRQHELMVAGSHL